MTEAKKAPKPAAKAAPSQGDRLDKLEKDVARLTDLARRNGWSMPGAKRRAMAEAVPEAADEG